MRGDWDLTGKVEIGAREGLKDCKAEEKVAIQHPTWVDSVFPKYGDNNCSSPEDNASYNGMQADQNVTTAGMLMDAPARKRLIPKSHIRGALLTTARKMTADIKRQAKKTKKDILVGTLTDASRSWGSWARWVWLAVPLAVAP
jgi:hypothetical protein